jgi:hypothetical protein
MSRNEINTVNFDAMDVYNTGVGVFYGVLEGKVQIQGARLGWMLPAPVAVGLGIMDAANKSSTDAVHPVAGVVTSVGANVTSYVVGAAAYGAVAGPFGILGGAIVGAAVGLLAGKTVEALIYMTTDRCRRCACR